MIAIVSYACCRCGARFDTRRECSEHEGMCDALPGDGLYMADADGTSFPVRVEGGAATILVPGLCPRAFSGSATSILDPGWGYRPATDAEAVMAVHAAVSDAERYLLMAFRLPPYRGDAERGGRTC